MDKFKKNLQDHEQAIMVHVSLDNDKKAAEEWAEKESFPWYTILPEKVKASGIRKFKSTKYVPEYVLVDKNGEVLASGEEGVFKTLQEYSKNSKKKK